jgi:hypothetical protein
MTLEAIKGKLEKVVKKNDLDLVTFSFSLAILLMKSDLKSSPSFF